MIDLLTGTSAGHATGAGVVTPVFQNVSLAMRRGEIVGVFGPNGSGKSTLLRVMAGLHPAWEGNATARFKRVTWIPQQYRETFFPWASLRTNCQLVMQNPWGGWQSNRSKLDELLGHLEIDVNLKLRPSECSGGMLQQIAILRALAAGPDLILADEPFSALDVDIRRRLRARFAKFVRDSGACAVVVLHDPEDLVVACDRVLVIPGRPFTTDGAPGCHLARLITNQSHPTDPTDRAATEPLLHIAQRMLRGPAEALDEE